MHKGPQAEKEAYGLLRAGGPQQLVFLEVEPGRVTADVGEVDKAVTKTWQDIYAGNAQDHADIAPNFVAKYKDDLYVQPEAERV